MKLGIRSRWVPQHPLELGILGDELQGGAEQADGGLLAGGEEVGRDADHVDDVGRGPVGERRRGQARQHVRPGDRPPVLHVGGELLVQVFQG